LNDSELDLRSKRENVESFFHKVSRKYLPLYVAELSGRISLGRQSRDADGPKVSLVCIDRRSERVDSVATGSFEVQNS
jgi:hypothetical protein